VARKAEARKAIAQAVEKRAEQLRPTSEANLNSSSPGSSRAPLAFQPGHPFSISPAKEALAKRRGTGVLEETPSMVRSIVVGSAVTISTRYPPGRFGPIVTAKHHSYTPHRSTRSICDLFNASIHCRSIITPLLSLFASMSANRFDST